MKTHIPTWINLGGIMLNNNQKKKSEKQNMYVLKNHTYKNLKHAKEQSIVLFRDTYK